MKIVHYLSKTDPLLNKGHSDSKILSYNFNPSSYTVLGGGGEDWGYNFRGDSYINIDVPILSTLYESGFTIQFETYIYEYYDKSFFWSMNGPGELFSVNMESGGISLILWANDHVTSIEYNTWLTVMVTYIDSNISYYINEKLIWEGRHVKPNTSTIQIGSTSHGSSLSGAYMKNFIISNPDTFTLYNHNNNIYGIV